MRRAIGVMNGVSAGGGTMNKKDLAMVVCAVAAALTGSLLLSYTGTGAPSAVASEPRYEQIATCGTESAATGETSGATNAPDPGRVPPGCCTSNCNTDKDCNRICGKGNCVCLATSDCCRRCTY
jgi:hypothetical protein